MNEKHCNIIGDRAGLILSVESNQNVESKMKNVESKPRNCGVQNWVATEQPLFCTFAWNYHRYESTTAMRIRSSTLLVVARADDNSAPIFTDASPEADS